MNDFHIFPGNNPDGRFSRKDLAADRKAELFKYFNWCLTSGATAAKRLQYVPLPENVVQLIQKEVLK